MFEYKVVLAPKARKSIWRKGRTAETLNRVFNDMAADDWEFQSSERGFSGSEDMLVFRRRVPTLEETNEKANARVELPETFEKPVIPRRPRPQPLNIDVVPQFQARRTQECGAPKGQISVVMAATK